MKKDNYIWFLLPLLWCFWYWAMKGHIGYWEETNFFQKGIGYWNGFACRPGGWSDYLGHFLVQWYQWTWAGALIITLLTGGIYMLTRGIVREMELKRYSRVLSVIPVALVCILAGNEITNLGDLLKVFFFFLLFWCYLKARNWYCGRIWFTMAYFLIFFLIGGGGAVVLYVSMAFREWVSREDGKPWIWMGGWVLLVTVFPLFWKNWGYVMPAEDIYRLSGPVKFLLWGLYGYGLLLLVLSRMKFLKQEKRKKFSYYAEFAVVWIVCLGGFYYAYSEKSEYFFRMEQAAERGQWDQVLQLAQQTGKDERETMYLVCLALAGKGELGEHLFEYPVWGLGCLYFPRETDYKTSALGGELYYRLKIPNEAIHWTFQASVDTPQGMNFRTLRRLIEVNLLKRDSLLADKYLTILENTVGYGSWCQEKRMELSDPQSEYVSADSIHDFFIGGRPFLSDLARVLDAGWDKNMTLDYILCGLLLNKDLGKFCRIFDFFYPVKEKRISRAYQEALMVAMTVGNRDVTGKSYPFDPEVTRRFEDYNALYRTVAKNKEQAREIMKDFKDTWWYYFHFTEPKLMDEKGHVMNINYSLYQ